MPRSGCLPELFCTENALRAVAGYNTHENFSRRQYGGTFQLTFGSLAARVVDTGVDDRGLGRYAWTKFQGRNGHVARIVSIYVPCKASRSSGDLTVMNQHRRYFDAQDIPGCPRQLLMEDIRACLLLWRQAGERLVVFIDANENMTNGPFHHMFVHPELGMREAVVHRHPDPRWPNTATYHKGDALGKCPIDGVYATPDLPFDAASWLQFMPHLGDHRFAVLDINSEALVGDSLLKIVRPAARRLSCNIPAAVAKWIDIGFFHSFITYIPQGMGNLLLPSGSNWSDWIGSGRKGCYVQRRSAGNWQWEMWTSPRKWIRLRSNGGFGNRWSRNGKANALAQLS